jgi:trigger factor
MLLDAIAESVNVQVSQDELTQYLVQSSAQYGMSPQDFVNALQEGNQLPAIVGEVARNKALAVALGKVTVVDTNGKTVDLTGFVAVEDEDEASDEAEEAPKKAPAKKPAAKKAPAKKAADADEAAEEAPAAKKPAAKKAPAKKAPAKKPAAAKE